MKTRFINSLILTCMTLLTLSAAGIVRAQENIIRTPDEILAESGDIPTPEAIHELFINCSEWDEEHSDVQDASRDALVDLGVIVVPTLLERWLSSVDLRRRIELDNIIGAIGHPSAVYLIPWLESTDMYTRRHAAYLLGDTAAIEESENPLALGPLGEDLPAIEGIVLALETETDWHAVSSMLGALGRMRDPGQIGYLSSFLSNEEQAVRLAAVIALGRIPVQETVPHLIRAFSDPLTNVRSAAIIAISSETNGNLAFEGLVGRAILPATGTRVRLCALESLSRYLDGIKTDTTDRANQQRHRAFDAATTVIGIAVSTDMWLERGYAIDVIGFTHHNDAENYLEILLESETHPFVISKINEALDRLEEGPPEPEEEEATS